MEGIVVSRKEARGSLHRRALSQASTASSTMHSPNTAQSVSASSSSHPRASTPSNAPHTHRYHHGQCEGEAAGVRQTQRPSRESSGESKRPITPASSLLQERLQQERRAESERLASRWGSDLSSSTGDIRDGDAPSLSGRRFQHVGERRPRSSLDDDSSQNSMGARRIEKAVSTLHKQNFDLKLELYHRREKQSTLEMRVEELETARRDLTGIQENLLGELAKRDKAIEEAVNMIVQLETRVDDLVRERDLALQSGAAGGPYPWSDVSSSLRTDTPKPGNHGASPSAETKTLERMPSFLSDQSTYTQHLRSVVLQNYSSPMHLRKVSEISATSADLSDANGVASPSVSMLSESSFISIYGSKHGQEDTGLLPLDHVSGMDGTFGDRSPTPTKRTMMNSVSSRDTIMPSHILKLAPRPATSMSTQAIPANTVTRRGSPVKKIEKLGGRSNSVDHTFRPSTSSHRRTAMTPGPQFVRSMSQSRNRRERRGAPEKVVTNYPVHNELANSHALPPTPDTASSSILREHGDLSSSQGSLRVSNDARVTRLPGASLPCGTEYLRSLASQEDQSGTTAQKAQSPTATGDRLLQTPGFMKLEKDILSDLGRLARSAATTMTTTATATRRPRSDSFASDSDSDGGADARSDSESCDYWMRESLQPDKGNRRSSTRRERGRSPSPDLFSFPVDSGGWQPDAMFGALNGGGFLGSPVPALKRDPTDEVAPSGQSPPPGPTESTANGPRPPSRRSSLNPQAAGHSLLASLTGRAGKGSSHEGGARVANARGRSNSMDGAGQTAPPGTGADVGSPSKRSQYPPISGLQSRARGLALNSFFRRSGPESYGSPSHAAESAVPTSAPQRSPSIPPTHFRHLKRLSGRSSVPPPATIPWATRPTIYMVQDELTSATPPPIMRNRPPPLRTDLTDSDGTALDASQMTEADAYIVASSATAEGPSPMAPQSGGGVRKWLGLGRRGSLKNRTG
ncbi:hypothetical protein SAMD00023353_7600290 [Rosellinia necatrix]|uniref:Centrosomin N-terminal motif 1 domain-containing protein n=1 Tax=Rosellinia necatrix TaxID=77044 RepID=A0A1W2TUJ0_ROSNE|nr:hypothetical protein SAMD00023353_7600290 [Rosellinia necatrix]